MLPALALALLLLLPGDPPPGPGDPPPPAPVDDGPVTLLGAEVVGKPRIVLRGSIDKIAGIGMGVDMATITVAETLWGTPPEGNRVRILCSETGFFARIHPTSAFILEPLEGGDRFSCVKVLDGGGAEGAARLAAVRRCLEVERRPKGERAALLRALCFEGLGAEDAWTRSNAARELAHFAAIRPGAFSPRDLEDLRRTARRSRETALRPYLVEAVTALTKAGEEGRLAPGDADAVTLAGAPLLRKLREDPDPKVRKAAAEAAARAGPAGEGALMEAMAKDAAAAVRVAAAEALGGAGTPERAGPALLERAKDDRDPAVRAAAIESLGLLRVEAAVVPLHDLVKAEPLLARPAAFALARIRSAAALESLRALRAEAAAGGEIRAAIDFLLSEDFVKQEEALRKVRAADR